jgi:hypothetical protein
MANGQQNAQAAQVRQQVAAATQLARFSEPEFWFSQSPAITAAGGLTTINAPGPFNLVRPIESLSIFVSMRVTVTVGAYAAVAPEAPQNYVQLIQIQGNHKDFGGITPIQISGATAYAWGRQFQLETGGGEYLISKAGGALTRAAQPGRPFTSAFDGTVATHDMIIMYHVPFGPSIMPSPIKYKQSTNFLLQPLDWGNTLNLRLLVGDASSLGDPTGATVAFAGFGGSGNPLVSVFTNYALLGEFQNKMQRSGVVIRNEQQLPSQTGLATAVLLQQLQHQISTTVMLKTGRIQATGLTAGVDTLASLSDLQTENTQLVVDNKPLRNNLNNMMEKSYHERMFNTVVPEGYFPLTFADSGSSLTAYRGDKLPGGSQFNLNSNIITANANQRQRLIQEYILGGPFPA